MITTPEIICDVFSFLDKDQIERIQLVNQFWNNVIIRHKNILPLRQFAFLGYNSNQIYLYATEEERSKFLTSYLIMIDGTNLSKSRSVSSRYSHLTVDEVLTNLNNVVYEKIYLSDTYRCDTIRTDNLDKLLNRLKLVTTKTGGRFRGKVGEYYRATSDLVHKSCCIIAEIFDNYIIVDELALSEFTDSYIRKVCANPEIIQFPSTPKEIILRHLEFYENDEVLNFTCNGKLNGANRFTIIFATMHTSYENFIRQWFNLYRTHQNPISLVGKFEAFLNIIRVLDAVKTFLNNTQLRVKYSLETKEFHNSYYGFIRHYLKRSCVLYETESYALVIEVGYEVEIDMSSINASDLEQPSCDKIKTISFCVKSL